MNVYVKPYQGRCIWLNVFETFVQQTKQSVSLCSDWALLIGMYRVMKLLYNDYYRLYVYQKNVMNLIWYHVMMCCPKWSLRWDCCPSLTHSMGSFILENENLAMHACIHVAQYPRWILLMAILPSVLAIQFLTVWMMTIQKWINYEWTCLRHCE